MTTEHPHKDFAHRLSTACDSHPDCPGLNRGRLTWLRDQLEELYGLKSTVESSRRWLNGMARPRHKTISALAALLNVEEAWLSIGDRTSKDAETRQLFIQEKGLATVLAGLIQLGGGTVAAPDDTRARDEKIHLHAIIRGAQYHFHIVAMNADGGFRVPVLTKNLLILGATITGTHVRFFEIDAEQLAASRVINGDYIVETKPENLPEILDFSRRI